MACRGESENAERKELIELFRCHTHDNQKNKSPTDHKVQ